jgi:predicted DNA-binding transcriptional regulator AlpA
MDQEVMARKITKRFLNMREVHRIVGLPSDKIKSMFRLGRFPRPYQLGPKQYGFVPDEIDRWVRYETYKNKTV